MSLEAIKTISEAEDKAKTIKAEAASEAKRMLNEAEAAGKAAIAAAEKKAADELSELSRKAEETALANSRSITATNDKLKADLQSKAENRMDKAVSLITERIVNG